MDWARDFYTKTGAWWGPAEAAITDRDLRRVALVERHAGPAPKRLLELGSGYGSTAAAATNAGYTVTGVELSDRADFADRFRPEADRIGSEADRLQAAAGQAQPGADPPGKPRGGFQIVKDDFYRVQLDGRFDVVCYWNGFGIGADADQRRLLRRIANDWLTPDGVALIDVCNPFVWARWDGDEEHKAARPDAGYAYSLDERTTYDPVQNRGIDTWWESDAPDRPFSQTLRCYTPADLALLLEGTGLALAGIVVGDAQLDPAASYPSLRALLTEQHEYLAVLGFASG